MYPLINNKSFMECTQADFEVLLHNPDYRENHYIDYKEDFSFLKTLKEKDPKEKVLAKITDFRNDICAFANADGGYIIYGIRDNEGTAAELIGVEIDNPDKFELDLRNKLMPIMPKIPPVTFRFLHLDNGRYLVIAFIEHDYYAPYIHIEEQKNFKIYKRNGNGNTVINYTELKNMFVQSRVLEDEILQFRKQRINYYKDLDGKKFERFMLFQMIPESFQNYRIPLFIRERQTHQSFGAVFSGTDIDSHSFPCVDGLRFISLNGNSEAILYNTGISEFFLPLTQYVDSTKDGLFFYNNDIWNHIEYVIQGYQSIMMEMLGNQRYFGCICIIGCKDVITERNDYGRSHTLIDRNEIICQPIPFINTEDKASLIIALKQLHLEFLLSIGIKRSPKVQELIDAISQR